MARASQAARRRPAPAKAVPTGLWVMVGIVVLLFIGILVWLGSRPEQPQAEAKTLPLQAPVKAVGQEPKPEAKSAQTDVREVRAEESAKAVKPIVPPPPRYDFYQMLPEQSVGTTTPVPPEVVNAKAPPSAKPPAAPTDVPPQKVTVEPSAVKEVASLPPAVDKAKVAPSTASQVTLQVGSFRRYEEADRRKAELAMLGFSASVQAANVNGETWHRVKLGPMPDAEARKIRDRLKAVGMNPLLVKGG